MAVDPTGSVSGSQSSNTPTASAKTSTLNYDSFLKLLIAQMQNQDPTKPMDSTEFVAQLASFSNVEQGMQTNSKLDSLMTSMALVQADGLIGRTVTSSDGKEVTLDAGITVSQHEPS